MKTLFSLILSSAIVMFSSLTVQATHLMGGNMTYTYIGFNPVNGTHTYEITLKIYRYCTGGSTAILDPTMEIGVYAHDPLFPNANKQLVTTVTAPLISQSFIQPPSPNPNCSFTANECVEEGIYQGTMSLASSIGGYHLMADRCCRNGNIMNLSNPGAAGQAYYAFIPPTNTANSSPTFAIPPVPFMCANDTTSILNVAFDPDGDSLVYSFEIPYNGVSTSGNPIPGAPLTYPWPISLVSYAGGFSMLNPFGANGMATINTATGLTTYFSPLAGFFVIAVEIKEYRNGILIGITRRDLQIIVINCPPNPAPVLSNAGGSGQTSVTVPEGAVINFPVTFNDPNQDSLTITASGPIFNPSVTNPAAVFAPASGMATASAQFSWTTSCGQGVTIPYQFVVTATDNGCPAKVTNVVYTINVVPVATSPITGPDTLCLAQATGIGYSVVNDTSNTYTWQVSGGIQASGGNSSSITVDWTDKMGTVTAWAVNSEGCNGDTVTLDVLNINPMAEAGSDVSVCSGQTVPLGGVSNFMHTYQWTPSTGLSNDTISNPVLTAINNGAAPVVVQYIVTATKLGCTVYDTVEVTINPPPAVTISLPDTVNLSDPAFALSGGMPAGGTYSGPGVSGGMFDPMVAGVGLHTITYTYTDVNGCTNLAAANIYVDLIIVTLDPFAAVCLDEPPFALTGGLPLGGTYSGAGVSGGIFDPAAAGVGTHTITYSYLNGVPASQPITVYPLPTVTISVAPAIGCQSNTIFVGYGPNDLLLTANSATAVAYQWYLDGNIVNGATSQTHQATVEGDYTVEVTDANGCKSDMSSPASIATINVIDVRCGNNLKKIILCHVPPGNYYNPQTLCIAESAIPAHLANHPWDCIGPCSLYYNNKISIIEDLHYHITPNPVNDRAELSFMIFEKGNVKIEMLDMLGRSIKNIYDDYTEADQENTVEFNVSGLSEGVYLVRIQSPDGIVIEKVTVVK